MNVGSASSCGETPVAGKSATTPPMTAWSRRCRPSEDWSRMSLIPSATSRYCRIDLSSKAGASVKREYWNHNGGSRGPDGLQSELPKALRDSGSNRNRHVDLSGSFSTAFRQSAKSASMRSSGSFHPVAAFVSLPSYLPCGCSIKRCFQTSRFPGICGFPLGSIRKRCVNSIRSVLARNTGRAGPGLVIRPRIAV